MSKSKLAAVLAVVTAAALVPLYGDPRNAPVTHPEWARMLMRALNLETAVERSATASQVFAILSWKNSLAYSGPRYASADGVRVGGDPSEPYVQSETGVGEVVYPLAVTRGGDYRLRARLEGDPSRPASAEIVRVGETDPTGAFTLVPATAKGWVDAGSTHLDPGAYSATILLPPGTSLYSVEVAPPCVAAVEPIGGWGPTEALDTEDVAVTAVKALDQESELPPAATPVEVSASEFQVEPLADGTRTAIAQQGEGRVWSVAATTRGLRATIFLEVPESGLYTISMLGVRGGGTAWLTDSCRKSILCGSGAGQPETPGWHVVTTAPLSQGRHTVSVVLSPGAEVRAVRAERKKATGADYVSTLKRLGFDVGPAGPMPRARAIDAMRWLEGRSATMGANTCGDVALPTDQTLVAAGLLAPTQLAQPQAPPLASGPGTPPLGAPLIPPPTPQPTVITPPVTTLPIVTPTTTPPPVTTPPPAIPTPLPSPPVLPCVEPVTPDLPSPCPPPPFLP
jgi:hypothetical protein